MKDQVMDIYLLDDQAHATYYIKRKIELADIAAKIKEFQSSEDMIADLKQLIQSQSPWPDILIFDMELPSMDVWEMLAAYEAMSQNSGRSIRLAMTGDHLTEDIISKAKEVAEIEFFVRKPLESEDIKAICETLIWS